MGPVREETPTDVVAAIAAEAGIAVQRGDHAEGDAVAAAAAGAAGPRDGRVPHVPAKHAVGRHRRGVPHGRRGRDAAGAAPRGPRLPDRAPGGACSPTWPCRRRRTSSSSRELSTPVGEFHEAAQILDSGLLEEAGIGRVGIVGHPEGHPDVADDELYRALVTKCRIARGRGLDLHLVTQFAFAPEPIVAWERGIRAMGVDVPVHVGLPGLTSPTRLLRFGLRCGVGASLKVLRQQAGGVLKLATSHVHHPDETLVGLAAAAAADPESLLHAGPCTSSRSVRSQPRPRGRATSATAASSCPTATACGSPPDPPPTGHTHVFPVRPGNRPIRHSQAARRDRRRHGSWSAPHRALRGQRRKDQTVGDRGAGRSANRSLRRGVSGNADAAR